MPKKKKKSGNKETVANTEVFQFDGMVSVFDYHEDEDWMKEEKIFQDSSGIGTKKRPHVRSGHKRHLQSGDVVDVRSTVIHPDEFSGYLSGERINS